MKIRKIVSGMLCVLLLAVTCVGHADTRSLLIDHIVELLNSDKMAGVEEVRYDAASNTLQMLCKMDVDYDAAKDEMQTSDEMKELFLSYDVKLLQGALKTAEIDDVNTIVVWLVKEDRPIFLSLNGSDASWLLKMN